MIESPVVRADYPKVSGNPMNEDRFARTHSLWTARPLFVPAALLTREITQSCSNPLKIAILRADALWKEEFILIM